MYTILQTGVGWGAGGRWLCPGIGYLFWSSVWYRWRTECGPQTLPEPYVCCDSVNGKDLLSLKNQGDQSLVFTGSWSIFSQSNYIGMALAKKITGFRTTHLPLTMGKSYWFSTHGDVIFQEAGRSRDGCPE